MPTILTVATLAAGRLDGPRGRAHGNLLGVGVEADLNDRAEVQSHLRRGLRVHDRLVGIVWICEPPRNQVRAVLGRVLTTRGAFEHRRLPTGRDTKMLSVHEGEVAVEPHDRVHAADEWLPEDLGDCRRVVADRPSDGGVRKRGEDLEIGGMNGSQVGHVGRLGPPGTRDRPECHASEQPDQHDQREVVAPPLPEGGPEPVRRCARGGGSDRPSLCWSAFAQGLTLTATPRSSSQCASSAPWDQGG